MPEIITAPQSRADFLVFINRQPSGPASFRAFPRERARQGLEQVVCYGEQELRIAQKTSLGDLLSAQVVELRYSDLDSAVACLRAMVRDGA
jgi:hypothetical protein